MTANRSPSPGDEAPADTEPVVYAISMDGGHPTFTRRRFVELAALGSAAIALGACGEGGDDDDYAVAVERPETTAAPAVEPETTVRPLDFAQPETTETPAPTATAPPTTTTTVPPEPGTVPPGEEGAELDIEGEAYTLPCGSPIPAGAVCTCNCVSVPSCGCVGHTSCSCVGHTVCTCDAVGSHYWYPN